jgi:ferredoxin
VADDIRILDLTGLQTLVDRLAERGYTVLGPTVDDGVIAYRPITSVAELPAGWGDEQGPAHYRLVQRGDGALFRYAAPAQSARPVLFPADELLWRSRRGPDGGITIDAAPEEKVGPPYAFLGVRSCDLRAVEIHDQVLTGRFAGDVHYAARRTGAFVVAVTCSDPAGTCFCASVDAGPVPRSGFDLALTELSDDGAHRFVVTVGSARGTDLLDDLGVGPAAVEDVDRAEQVGRDAAERMGRHLDVDGLRDLLYRSSEAQRWDDVASRCLACTNCTLVCPTCFCTTITDSTDLTGASASRHRVWDSCFSREYSYIHGGSVRDSVRSRYRQWLTHKLASWQDQFGSIGCVGCGRCITWCPAGIDITAEVAALQAADTGTR